MHSILQVGGFNYILFSAIVIALSFVLKGTARKFVLLIASLLFYATFSWYLVLTVLLLGLANFYGVKLFHRPNRRSIYWLIILFNLLILILYKYSANTEGYLISIGISFVTFQGIGYVTDVYRNEIKRSNDPVHFLLFISFFPQLVAGPIESFKDLGFQLTQKVKFNWDVFSNGLKLILYGAVLKFVVADRLALIVDTAYTDVTSDQNSLLSILGVFFFSFQIYFDFFAYCLIAAGIAGLMGIQLSQNFNAPYLSNSFQEFWKNWHITLHVWLKKYLFKPLLSLKINPVTSLFIVFILSSLWHGINLTYVLWGVLSAAVIIIEKKIPLSWGPVRFLKPLFVFAVVTVLWIPFRAQSIDDALAIIQSASQIQLAPSKLFIADLIYQSQNYLSIGFGQVDFGPTQTISFSDFFIAIIGLSLIIIYELLNKFLKLRINKELTIIILLGVLVFFGFSEGSQFIYFQF